jgi:hypothetical protein
LTGAVTGSGTFNGEGNLSIATTGGSQRVYRGGSTTKISLSGLSSTNDNKTLNTIEVMWWPHPAGDNGWGTYSTSAIYVVWSNKSCGDSGWAYEPTLVYGNDDLVFTANGCNIVDITRKGGGNFYRYTVIHTLG